MADPCAGRQRIAARNPGREQHLALLKTWHDLCGSDAITVKEAIAEATRDLGKSDSQRAEREALHDAMMEVAGRSGVVSPTALGKFIARYENRIEGGLRFEKAGKAKCAALRRVVAMDDHGSGPSKGDDGKVGKVLSVQNVVTIIKTGIGPGKITVKRPKKVLEGLGIGSPVPTGKN